MQLHPGLALMLGAVVPLTSALEIHFNLRKALQSGETEVTITSGGTLYAYACAATLELSDVGSVTYDVDNTGHGNLTVGEKTYLIHGNPEYSGGVACGSMHDHDSVEVDCSADLDISLPAPTTQTETCITDAHALFMPAQPEILNLGDADEEEAAITPRAGFRYRRQQTCLESPQVENVGNGNPHQNYKHIQLTQTLRCGATPNRMAYFENGKSWTVGFEASISAAGWITGGFAVQRTLSTGDGYQCPGASNNNVCVWLKMAHTAYTVHKRTFNTCSWRYSPWGPNYILSSPNIGNRGGRWYCVEGTYCRNQRDYYWDRTSKEVTPGGPPPPSTG